MLKPMDAVPSPPLVVFLSWKDARHPAAGGAELVHTELSQRFVRDGFRVVHLTPGFAGCTPTETIEGVTVIRIGKGIFSFYRLAGYFRRHLRAQTTLLVDVFNCFGSFACLLMPPANTLFTVYHVQDRMWFYQTTFAGVPRWLMPVVNSCGFFVEKLQLLLLARLYRGQTVTISESTVAELRRYGFPAPRLNIISTGIRDTPLKSLAEAPPQDPRFTVLMIGPRKSKRPAHTLRAFAEFHRRIPDSTLWVAGWGTESDALARLAGKLGVRQAVLFLGRLSEAEKRERLQRSHVLCTTPVKEGWGLVVLEANAFGIPVIGYDVPGLRDALAFGNGILCRPSSTAMADGLEQLHRLWREQPDAYRALRQRALDSTRNFTFDRGYAQLRGLLPPEVLIAAGRQRPGEAAPPSTISRGAGLRYDRTAPDQHGATQQQHG